MVAARLAKRLSVVLVTFAVLGPASIVVAATPSSSAIATAQPPALEGGAVGTAASIDLGHNGVFTFVGPSVVTPPGGGSREGHSGPVSSGGFPPYDAATVSVGPAVVHTNGDIRMSSDPVVDSSSYIAGLSLLPSLGGIDLRHLSSECRADDTPGPEHTVEAHATAVGRVGDHTFGGVVPPDTRVDLTLGAGSQTLRLTVVLNETVLGQSADHFAGILVNAVHVYPGAPGSGYSTEGAIFGQSRCEVAPAPIPPGVVPEAAVAVLLPASAVVVVGLGLLLVRRRRRDGGT